LKWVSSAKASGLGKLVDQSNMDVDEDVFCCVLFWSIDFVKNVEEKCFWCSSRYFQSSVTRVRL